MSLVQQCSTWYDCTTEPSAGHARVLYTGMSVVQRQVLYVKQSKSVRGTAKNQQWPPWLNYKRVYGTHIWEWNQGRLLNTHCT